MGSGEDTELSARIRSWELEDNLAFSYVTDIAELANRYLAPLCTEVSSSGDRSWIVL